jgi:phosphate transport system substrate-binding protein
MRASRILAALFIVGACLGIGAVPGAVAATGPHAVVTPSSGISDPWNDGQYVTVRWSGFAPNKPVGVRECQHGATDASQCSRGDLYSSCGFSCPGDSLLGVSDGHGKGSGTVPVATGLINVEQDLSTPVPGQTFRCGPADPCDLWIYNDPFDLTSGVMEPIGFLPPVDACAGGEGLSLLGSGPASALRQFRALAIDACTPPDNLDLGYVLKVSRDAMDDYVGGFAPFAVSSVKMDNGQEQAMDTAGRTAGYAPVLASGEVFGFRMVDTKTHNQVTTLTLTPDLLARIFSGQLRNWNIPAIKQLNPGVSFPTSIAPIGRGDACEETQTTLGWFWSTARNAWIDGGEHLPPASDPYRTGPTDILPSVATSPNPVALVTGPQAVANTVRTGGADFSSITAYGTIGYMDSSVASQYGLPTVRIRYPGGATVAPTPKTIGKALDAMRPGEHGVWQPNFGVRSATQWPMPVVSYLVIPRGSKKSDAPPSQVVGDAVANLVKLAVTTGQQDLVAGYAPLPKPFVQQAETAAKQIWTAPPEPPWNPGGNTHQGGGDGQPPVPNDQTGGGTGGGTVPTGPLPTTGDPTTAGQTSTPPPVPIVDPVAAPSLALAASVWSRAVPAIAFAGLGCLVVGGVLLFGPSVRRSIARAPSRVRKVVPLRRKSRADDAGHDEAAA